MTLYEMSDILEHIASLDMTGNRRIDYGTGQKYTSVEAHTVSYIAGHPGCTVTEIAANWGKTKGAVSQIIKKLRGYKLILSRQDPSDAKRSFLFVTQEGQKLDAVHRAYDEAQWKRRIEELERYLTPQEVEKVFLALREWNRFCAQEAAAGKD